MNRKHIINLFLISIFIFAMTWHASPVSSQSDTCNNPDQTVFIAGQAGFKYNVSTITVAKNTCVKFTLVNEDPSLPHDFVVDADNTLGIPEISINVEAGNNATSVTVMIPDQTGQIKFYCSVAGHRDSGMEGDLIVSDTTAQASIEILTIIFSIGLIGLAIPILRRKK